MRNASFYRKKFSVRHFWEDCHRYNCNGAQYIGEICRYLLSAPETPEEKLHKVDIMIGNGLRPPIWDQVRVWLKKQVCSVSLLVHFELKRPNVWKTKLWLFQSFCWRKIKSLIIFHFLSRRNVVDAIDWLSYNRPELLSWMMLLPLHALNIGVTRLHQIYFCRRMNRIRIFKAAKL